MAAEATECMLEWAQPVLDVRRGGIAWDLYIGVASLG
jgi:hypothetical protein